MFDILLFEPPTVEEQKFAACTHPLFRQVCNLTQNYKSVTYMGQSLVLLDIWFH
jgi:hypothetical protein